MILRCSCHAYVIFVTISWGTDILCILIFRVFQYLRGGLCICCVPLFLYGCGTYLTLNLVGYEKENKRTALLHRRTHPETMCMRDFNHSLSGMRGTRHTTFCQTPHAPGRRIFQFSHALILHLWHAGDKK